MGQRARRQLAEKQFGGGAKHLALPPPPEAAHGPPLAAQPGLAAAKHGRGAAPGKARGAEAAEALHPSWAAKRQQQGSLLVPAAGKKVVFGDDGTPARVTSPAAAATAATIAGSAAEIGIRRDQNQPGNAAQSADPQHHTARNGISQQRGGAAVTPARAQTQGRRDERVIRNGVRFRSDDASVTARDAKVRKPAGGGGLHPSWEAKKLLRQQMERLPAPKGAKVVFQDSD